MSKKVLDHLHADHEDDYAFHDKMAMAHKAMQGHHEPGSPDHTFHKDAHEAHVASRDHAKRQMAECAEAAKAAAAADLVKFNPDRLIPTNASAIAPPRPEVRAIPRAGSPTISAAAGPSQVAQFEEIFGKRQQDVDYQDPTVRN